MAEQMQELKDFSYKNTLWIRGLAALAVVLVHCGTPVLWGNGYVFVGIFFFFSGFGLIQNFKNRENYLDKFLINRYVKLFVPFVVINVIYILVLSALGVSISIPNMILSTLLPYFDEYRIVTVSWYVSVIAIFYFAFFVCFKFLKPPKALFGMLVFLILYILISEEIIQKNIVWFKSCTTFYLGLLLGYNSSLLKKIININAMLMFIVCGFAMCLFVKCEFLPRAISGNLITLFASLLVVSFIPRLRLKNKVLDFLGSISYEIYLVHYLIMLFLDNAHNYVRPWWKNDMFSLQLESQVVVVVLTCLGSIIFAYLLHRMNEKVIVKIIGYFAKCDR